MIRRRAMQVAESLRSPWPWLWLATAYVTLSTRDVELGPFPAKFILTALAVGAWAGRRRFGQPWRTPVLVFAVALPIFGSSVAILRELTDDPAQRLGLQTALEEASRFTYALLALPLLDWAWLRVRAGRDPHVIWLGPAVVLASLTWVLYGLHLAGVEYTGAGRVGPLEGDIGVDPATGWFRAYMITNILFVPAVALLFVRLQRRNTSGPRDMILIVVLLGAVLLSHTRGLWLGILIACGTALLVRLAMSRPRLRLAVVPAGVALGLAAFAVAVPTAAQPVVELVTGGSVEQSTSTRLQQVPELMDGIGRHPILGSGFGAVLPSGFRRSDAVPWSFELNYLQVAFHTGVIGLLMVLLLPVALIVATTRRLVGMPAGELPAQAVGAVAGVGAASGLLVTFASNPYLVTSAGALTLALSAVLCDPRPLLAGSSPKPAASAGRRAVAPAFRRR